MAQSGQRKCLCCGLFFLPDHRNRERQRYCSAANCARASKAASQAAWLAQPENSSYFRDPSHVARVQAWRALHPGYGRGRRRVARALQDPLIVQVHDSVEESANRGESAAAPAVVALQDSWSTLSPALAGLIAHLFDLTLQEDMASTTRLLVKRGYDVINGSRGEDSQATTAARAAAPGARAVQLD
jgi:hypothetical protein